MLTEISHALYKAYLQAGLRRVTLEVSVPLSDFLQEDKKIKLRNLQKISNLQIDLLENRQLPQDKYRILHPQTKEDLTDSLIT
jgi:hypothetical protein